jgi:hypothetical protein
MFKIVKVVFLMLDFQLANVLKKDGLGEGSIKVHQRDGPGI